MQPALLVHFALVFPERRARVLPQLLGVYSVPASLLALHIFVATAMLDFLPSISSRDFLATLDLFYVGVYFLFAAAIFLSSYLRAPSGVLRQQLKWVTAGTFAGIFPFLPALCAAAPGYRGDFAAVDEAVGVFAGADPAFVSATPSFATG